MIYMIYIYTYAHQDLLFAPFCLPKVLPESFLHNKAKCVWAHRCSKKGCQKLMQPHQFHPIFFSGAGSSLTPLGHQAAVLCCALAGVPVTSTPVILDMDDKPVFQIYQNLEAARARHVLMKQKSITSGLT